MGPPDKTGRTALFNKFLSRMPVAEAVSVDKLAVLTEGLSGAQIEHLTNEAGLLAVKGAIAGNTPTGSVSVCAKHFLQAINVSKHIGLPFSTSQLSD